MSICGNSCHAINIDNTEKPRRIVVVWAQHLKSFRTPSTTPPWCFNRVHTTRLPAGSKVRNGQSMKLNYTDNKRKEWRRRRPPQVWRCRYTTSVGARGKAPNSMLVPQSM